MAPGFSTQFYDVEVDPETVKVTILRFVAAQDVGCAIHPSYGEGQIQGGVARGIGWALDEEYEGCEVFFIPKLEGGGARAGARSAGEGGEGADMAGEGGVRGC